MSTIVTARGAGLGAWVDEDFAHCRQVVVVAEDGSFDAWDNPFPAEQNGDRLAEKMIEEIKDLKAVVTASIDPETVELFTEHRIAVYLAKQGAVLALVEAVGNHSVPRA